MRVGATILNVTADQVAMDGPSLFWAEPPSPAFLASIRSAGQLEPILVARSEAGGDIPWRLVAGCKRCLAARELGLGLEAREIEGGPLELGMAYVSSNLSRVPALDDAGLFRAARYFASVAEFSVAEQAAFPLLGLEPGSKRAAMFQSWLAMPDALAKHLLAGRVPLAAIGVLERFAPEDLEAVAEVFAEWSWSRGNAVNFLTWAWEASRAAGSGAAGILAEIRSAAFASGGPEGLSPKDAMARLCAVARAIRYPELTRLGERFEAEARELRSGTSWRIEQSDSFETSGVEISLRIKNRAGLDKGLADLERMARSRGWDALWSVADGVDSSTGGTHDES